MAKTKEQKPAPKPAASPADQSAHEADDPFAAFSEWSSEVDQKAYGGL